MTKLLRGLFDASQSDESEVHQIVARCVVETAVNLRWLLLRNDPEEYKRFRADSFVTWRKWLETTTATGDAKLDGIAVRMKQHIETELAAAGLTWADVPKQPGGWGRGSFRQRLADLNIEGLYLVLFATHSYYVHGSWHELRTFHLKTEGGGLHLDSTFGELAPPTSYEVTIAALQAACDYVRALPLPAAVVNEVVAVSEPTIAACARLGAAFADYVSRGGLDPLLERHATPYRDPPGGWLPPATLDHVDLRKKVVDRHTQVLQDRIAHGAVDALSAPREKAQQCHIFLSPGRHRDGDRFLERERLDDASLFELDSFLAKRVVSQRRSLRSRIHSCSSS
jgi:hypothetical protein